MINANGKIKAIIARKFNLNESDISLDTRLIGDLAADSLDMVELILALEEEFDIDVPDDEARKILTIKDVIKFVESQSSKQPGRDRTV